MHVTYGKGFFAKPANSNAAASDGVEKFLMPTEVSTTESMREKVERLEDMLAQLPPVEIKVRHHFAPGTYAREITIPKDTVLIGAVHKTDNLVVLSAGRLRLVTESGPVVISAPHTMICKAGAKNAAIALEDSVWTNFFATEETDPDKLVELLSYSTADELMGGAKNKQFIANQLAALERE